MVAGASVVGAASVVAGASVVGAASVVAGASVAGAAGVVAPSSSPPHAAAISENAITMTIHFTSFRMCDHSFLVGPNWGFLLMAPSWSRACLLASRPSVGLS